MANAFQDQLLKAGLVTKDKVNKSNKNKHKQAKQQSKNVLSEADKIKQLAKQAAQEKAEQDRELNRLKLEADNKKAINAQIRQLVEMNCVANTDGDVVYNFEDMKKIRRIYVTEELRSKIISGRLAIARLNETYMLVPKAVAEKIMQRDVSYIVLCNEPEDIGDEDDEYADYKVPDDLMW